MSAELPAYTGNAARCIACVLGPTRSAEPAATTYVPPMGDHPHTMVYRVAGATRPVTAFLKRTCNRCGFEWSEACLPL